MALPTCVKTLLCGLSAATRNALNTLIQSYVAIVDAEIVALEGYLIYLDVLTFVPSQLNTVVQTFITEVRAGANLVPLSLIGNCIEIGELNIGIVDTIESVLASANNISNDLVRLLSFRDEVEEAITDLRALLILYAEVGQFIEECEDA